MSMNALRIISLAVLTCTFSNYAAKSDSPDDFTFASHFINSPVRGSGPVYSSWAAKHKFDPYYKDYKRCSDPDFKLLFVKIEVSQAIDSVDVDFFYLMLFMPPYENSGKKDTVERWEARRAELIQIVNDASPMVTESFRVASRSALFDWSSLKCEEYTSKLLEHRNSIIAFNTAFRSYRERIQAVKAKYNTK